MIGYDDLGQPCWKWVTELAESAESVCKEDTFNFLEALSNDALEVADEPGATAPGSPDDGCNPYDTVRIKVDRAKLQRR